MITALILTLNEERHIARCIESLADQCERILVVDSGSQDQTVAIARRLGATVVFNPWINYAAQMNFAINFAAGSGGWLLRIDADEVLDTDSRETPKQAIARATPDTDGIVVLRRINFLGRRIRHGAIEPSFQLRMWREGRGHCELRWMDEHIQVVGRVLKSRVVISDKNENSLTWWVAKHNSYASREVIDILSERRSRSHGERLGDGASAQARTRRFFKNQVYRRMPTVARATLYFVYRYVFRLGFLDGKEGFLFHALQGFWYRTLVDAKLLDIDQYAQAKNISIEAAVLERTGIDIAVHPKMPTTQS
jgi:glycosyltransferase involved in cell wall biosynthesis